MFSQMKEKDTEYISDVQAAVLLKSPRGGRLILYMIVLLTIAFLTWAWFAEIDEVIKGQGKVVPSSHIQLIQNLEGGILKDVLVQEGQVVSRGDELLTLNDIQFSAELQKNAVETADMEIALHRLIAESTGDDLIFTDEMKLQHPLIVKKQYDLAKSRRDNLQNQIDVLQLVKREKKQQLAQLVKKKENAGEKFNLALQEQHKLEPLVAAGAVSEMEVLQAKQKVQEAKAAMSEATLAIPETQTAIEEAQGKIDQAGTEFREKAQNELSELTVKYQGLLAMQESLKDKVARTAIRSPVHGTVKKIFVDTIGGTIRPGMTMMEIVPLDDSLLIETQVAPKDVGFIRHGQKAKVKLTAYDYAVYGGLNGVVERVSADSITDQKGRTYFLASVSIPQAYMGDKSESLIIIPGMQAEVNIVVTRKRILDYLLKPLLKAKYE